MCGFILKSFDEPTILWNWRTLGLNVIIIISPISKNEYTNQLMLGFSLYYLYWTIKPHYIQNGIRLPHIIYVLSFALEDDYSSVTHFEGFNQTKFDLSSFPNIQFILLQHFVLRNPIRLFTSSTDLSINNLSYPG